jgi:outer membrane protein
MYRKFSFILFIILASSGKAQQISLQQCIDTAIANNITIKQKYLLMQSAEVDWHQSRSNLLPNLVTGLYHGTSQGKSIDPSSNNYVNQNLNYANYQLSSAITVFNGGNFTNGIKQYASAYEASKMEWQQAKDLLVLDVISKYLAVLNDEDLVSSAQKQADISEKQLERYQLLNKQGAIKPSDVSDLKGQLMNEQLSVLNSQNALESARLLLCQLMNKPYSPSLQPVRINIDEFLTAYNRSADEVYQNALQQFSLVKSVELRKRSSAYAVKSTRGLLYPNVVLDGGLNTRYSSLEQNASVKVPYNSQLSNNLATFVEVGIVIPIFNRSLYRNRVKHAEIEYKNTELVEQSTKLQLQQSIDQAYLDMLNAYKRYKLLIEQVAAFTESFKAAEVRYNAGVGTSVDYLTAKDRLDQSNYNLISAQYDFVLKKKILDYYNGK